MVRWISSAIVLTAVITPLVIGQGASFPNADDNWRRTVHGWERIENFSKSGNVRLNRTGGHPDLPLIRLDFHPAWLLGIELGAVVAGFCLFRKTG